MALWYRRIHHLCPVSSDAQARSEKKGVNQLERLKEKKKKFFNEKEEQKAIKKARKNIKLLLTLCFNHFMLFCYSQKNQKKASTTTAT